MSNPYVTVGNAKNITKDQWLEERNKGLGGSDASVAVGLNRYKSRIELYLEKFDMIEGFQGNEATEIGTIIEDTIATIFSERTGLDPVNCNLVLESTIHPFMRANLDRRGRFPDGTKYLLEIKNTNEYMKQQWEEKCVPEEYLAQLTHYLIVSGYEVGIFGTLVGGNKLKITVLDLRWKFGQSFEDFSKDNYVVTDLKGYTDVIYIEEEFDGFFDQFLELLIDNEQDFWNYINRTQTLIGKIESPLARKEVILKNCPPLMETHADYNYIAKKNAEQTIDEMLAKGPEFDELISREKDLKKQKKDVENRLKGIQGKIIEEIGEYIGAETASGSKATYKERKTRGFDIEGLNAENPGVYDRYVYDIPTFDEKKLKEDRPDLFEKYKKKTRALKVY